MTIPIARRRLDSLTGLRYFAALAVVLLHTVANRYVDAPLVDIPLLGRPVEVGYLAVAFFFTLSGFVLAWNARSADTKRAFYQRRFARVYPMHLLTALVAGTAILLAGGGLTVGGIIALLLLVSMG